MAHQGVCLLFISQNNCDSDGGCQKRHYLLDFTYEAADGMSDMVDDDNIYQDYVFTLSCSTWLYL